MRSLLPFKVQRRRTKAEPRDWQQLQAANRFLAARLKVKPEVAVVLGSGLDTFSKEIADAVEIPYSKIPYWPRSTVPGHAGRLIAGKLGDRAVVVMAGRCHLYEGYSPREVTFPI